MDYVMRKGDKLYKRNKRNTRLKVIRWKGGAISIDIMNRSNVDGKSWGGVGISLTRSASKDLMELLKKATKGE